MDNKKTFFELLDTKSSLMVGLVGGFLSLGTIGFIVLLALVVNGKVGLSSGNTYKSPVAVANEQAAQPAQEQPAPPPANIPKTDRPKAELFVMSYCPYGLQMEKAYLPAWELLKSKVDLDVKFVSYAMHDLKEVEENTRQYCVQKEQPDKFISYLKCFVGSGDSKSCLSQSGVNEARVQSCYNAADKKFGIMAQYNDKSKWLSGRFPVYPIHSDLNEKYGVQGSPTLVINGVQADVGRTPEAIRQAICAGFKNLPPECSQKLSTLAFQPGFGNEQTAGGGGATQPGCGT